MFRVGRTFYFEAAHRLPLHDGKCKEMHGHSYKVQIVLAGKQLMVEGPKSGMLVDFGTIKRLMSKTIATYDHSVLNDLEPFNLKPPKRPPTAENLCSVIAVALQWDIAQLFDESFGIVLDSVKVWETRDSFAEWSRE